LEKEKQLAHLQDELRQERARLPWEEVGNAKDYAFVGKDGPCSLADLFQDSNNLLVQHVMMEEDWDRPCSLCSFWVDTLSANCIAHLRQHAEIVAIATASFPKLEKAAQLKGWAVSFFSSGGCSFNVDYGVETPAAPAGSDKQWYNYGKQEWQHSSQAPGISAFHLDRKTGKIYHTYSTYARGLSDFNGVYSWIDILPGVGRTFEQNLPFGMAWVKPVEDYPNPKSAGSS
jgi:predicted dithiol-disulfide oxidoreductase (DUF899 family)